MVDAWNSLPKGAGATVPFKRLLDRQMDMQVMEGNGEYAGRGDWFK